VPFKNPVKRQDIAGLCRQIRQDNRKVICFYARCSLYLLLAALAGKG
jgi:hypothetical protein